MNNELIELKATLPTDKIKKETFTEKFQLAYTTQKNFVKCGVMGWCFEVIWTGFGNMLEHDKTLSSSTSLLMFPIYGMAAFISPIYSVVKDKPIFFRGILYTMLIFTAEFFSGMFLKKLDMCPWDYSHSPYNIKGIVRLDYAPAWFAVGLIYEKILKH